MLFDNVGVIVQSVQTQEKMNRTDLVNLDIFCEMDE